MKVVNWKTCLSDVSDLYFESIIDKGELIVQYLDKEDQLYEITAENRYAFKVSDEELLGDYWKLKKELNIGWSFIVEDSTWLPTDYESAGLDYKHFVISSWDMCVEILATNVNIFKRPLK